MTTVCVLASLDTKADEAAFLVESVRRAGATPWLVDTSAGGGEVSDRVAADVPAASLVAAAGLDVDELAALDRAPAVRAMAAAAADHVAARHAAGELHALLGAGGSNAALVFAAAAARLPFGVPKVVATTMAVVDARAVIGDADVTMLYPVVDVEGLNGLSRIVLAQSAAAAVAMAAVPPPADAGRRVVGATMFGVTTACVHGLRTRLEEAGDEVVVFHANGTGGRSLESLASGGAFDVVVDVTTTELADLVAGGTLGAGPERLDPTGAPGVPRVVVPGAVDMANFGARDTVPRSLSTRTFHVHNDNVTLMRTTPDENAEIGARLGDYVAARSDAVAVLPLRGVSALDRQGGPFWWPEADAALFDAVRSRAPGRTVEVDAHVNDAAFADRLVAAVGDLRAARSASR